MISLDHSFKRFYIRPEVEWSSSQHRVSKEFFEQKISDYMLLNLKVFKELNWNETKFSLSAGVENITDKAYREHFDVGQVLRPGRNFMIQLNAQF